MRRTIELLVVFLLSCLCVFAAGSQEKTVGTEPAWPIAIKVDTAQGGDGLVVLQKAAADFNASQDKYVVDLTKAGSYTEIQTRILTSMVSDRPAIFAASGTGSAAFITKDAAARLYVPANDFIKAEGYDMSTLISNLKTNYCLDGEWQCLPLGNTSVGQFYNNDILMQCGIDIDSLKSYEEILLACEKMVDAGYEHPYYLRTDYSDYLNYSLTAQGINYFDKDNGREGIPTKCLFDDGAECQAATTAYFAFAKALATKGYMVPVNVSASTARQMLVERQIAIMDGYSSGANAVIKLVNSLEAPFNLQYRVSPVIQKGAKYHGQAPGGGVLFIAKTDKWTEQGAWEFMKWLMKDQYTSAYAMATGYIPITTTGAQTPEYQNYINTTFPNAADVIREQNNTEPNIAYARIPFTSDYEAIFVEIVKRICTDAAYTPEQACADLAKRTNEAIELYRMGVGL
jgi:sn-glycerol 3-phosphate transport system substrate-binding protein